MTLQRSPLGVAIAGALLALTLAGCERHDTTAARPGDDTRAAQRNADERHADASQAIDQARERARAGGRDLGEAARSAGDATTDAVGDAAISTSINARYAKDPKLSALAIDVDTSGGKVVLHGTAPDAASKARATELAQGVHGVQSVDNELTVAPRRP
ncbi:MAG TPA: BON domain-containing protein [Ideonella sp.]|nr:BON domain-containing protein [Ideonella sp.]